MAQPGAEAQAGGATANGRVARCRPAEDEARPYAALKSALAHQHAAATNIGHGQNVIRIASPGARDVLSRGCPLDLHPRKFGVGRCAQSRFAKAPLLVALVDAAPTFDVIVRRSFAKYLWDVLVDSGAELK